MTQDAIPSHYRLALAPLADPAAVVLADAARFTVLTSRLIRLEHSATQQFEDRASQTFWYRRQPVPDFRVVRSADGVEIVTEHLHPRYRARPGAFRRDTLSIEVKETGVVWRYGDKDRANLLGTARTLDTANRRVRLSPGLLSRAGWAVVDDTRGLVKEWQDA